MSKISTSFPRSRWRLLPAAALAALMATGMGCSSTPRVNITPSKASDLAADGAILDRAACRVDTSPLAFANAVDEYYREDILAAKLAPQLAAKPLLSIFTQEENRRLATASSQGRCERIMYRSGGLRVAGYIVRPKTPGPHPVIIWLRGGTRELGKIEQVTLLNLNWLADAGFVVVAPQYRGVDGGEGADEFGGADVQDVMSLMPLVQALPGADSRRLYMLGGSRGAIEGTLAMRRGLPVRAAAFRGSVFDLEALRAFRPEFDTIWRKVMPDFPADPEGAMARRSAINWPRELRAPILMMHGRQDWRTELRGVQAMDAALARTGLPHKLVIYEGDEHQLAFNRPAWLQEAVAWFRTYGAFDSARSVR